MTRRPRAPGRVRQSQLVTMAGPGAMLDLPKQAVIVAGLEDWTGVQKRIHEERLVGKLEQRLGVPGLKLFAPPEASDAPDAPKTGAAAYQFPEWFVAHECEVTLSDGARSRPLVHQRHLVNGRYDCDRRKSRVVPLRFVQACPNGHISDVEWYVFVHEGDDDCRRLLWLDERGTSGDLVDLSVRCECGKSRSLAQAERPGTLGACRGPRPWLGPQSGEKCVGDDGKPEMSRLLIRTASNGYFAERVSVISIPDHSGAIRRAVDPVWEDYLQYVEDAADLARERRKAKVAAALEEHRDDDVLAEINRRKSGVGVPYKPIKQDELDLLMSSAESLGDDRPDGDFFARALRLAPSRTGLMAAIERVVLVHRLREVIAQVGFTRFQPVMPDVDGELDLHVRRAPLARDVTWLPAIENRGEGVFVALEPGAVAAWLERPQVQTRAAQLSRGFEHWKRERSGAHLEFPDLRYVMLHSLSHLLITAVALECGYAASSIRERIYVGEDRCGILLHTGSSDAEGTLGGLVQVGRNTEHHLREALELGRLCSNDPVCAQHDPSQAHEQRFLLGAACHGCLLIAETSCERRNELLDRALVVPTVEGAEAEFFTADLM